MDGIHDLGGKHGFGKVEREVDAPVFHEKWEAKVFAIMLASGPAGAWYSADRFRHLIERIDPVSYLSDGYYGRWLGGIETGLIEAGVLQQAEIAERFQALGGDSNARIAARPEPSPEPMGDPPSKLNSDRDVGAPRFRIGDRVTTQPDVKPDHTRLPAYARGKAALLPRMAGGSIQIRMLTVGESSHSTSIPLSFPASSYGEQIARQCLYVWTCLSLIWRNYIYNEFFVNGTDQ